MPNNDYIPRSDAISLIVNGNELIGRGWLIKELSTLPAADVEPVKHGYWVYKMRERNKCELVSGFDHLGDWHTITVITHVKGPVPYCGLCGALAADSFLDCCPRCGAKMDMEPQKGDAGNAD